MLGVGPKCLLWESSSWAELRMEGLLGGAGGGAMGRVAYAPAVGRGKVTLGNPASCLVLAGKSLPTPA